MFYNFSRIMIVYLLVLVGCTPRAKNDKSTFNLSTDYLDFSTRMENNDTLNLDLNLSACSWFEYDDVEITKKNDTLYYQIKERLVWVDKDEPLYFPKVNYKFTQDTMNLEILFRNLSTEETEMNRTPFLILTNPKENDSIVFYTHNLKSRLENIDRYNNLMKELYPTEMESYFDKFTVPEIKPPPPPPEPNDKD